MFCWKNIQILILLLWDFLRIGKNNLYGNLERYKEYMMLCILDSFVACQKVDTLDIARRFKEWMMKRVWDIRSEL